MKSLASRLKRLEAAVEPKPNRRAEEMSDQELIAVMLGCSPSEVPPLSDVELDEILAKYVSIDRQGEN